MARADATAVAGRARISAGLDISVPTGIRIAAACAGPLRDALGRVLRDAVAFTGGADVAVRVVGHVERDRLVLVAGDRGRAGGVGPQVDPRREAGLWAAGGCLAVAGGDLTAGVGPWGGVSVTIRVPVDRHPLRPDRTSSAGHAGSRPGPFPEQAARHRVDHVPGRRGPRTAGRIEALPSPGAVRCSHNVRQEPSVSSISPVRRRRVVVGAIAVFALSAGGAAALLAPLPPPDGLVNNDPAAGIDPRRPAGLSDITGGSLTAGGALTPWVVFEQATTGEQQVFARSFENGAWVTRGNPASINLDSRQDAEAPSIDFAGPGRTVPWVSWYEPSAALSGGQTNIFASRFAAAANRWLPSGQDRTSGGAVPSLNVNTDRQAENPAVAGGAAVAGADPVPWVAWQEKDGSDISSAQVDQIFVSRGVKAADGQTACTGFSPGSGAVVNGFCWQETGFARVSRSSTGQAGATDPSLNIDTTRHGIEPDIAFTGPSDTVPWVVWYETGNSGIGLRNNDMVFAAKGVKEAAAVGGFQWVAVGTAGSGLLDASARGGVCAATVASEDGCSLNSRSGVDAQNPRVAAGTMTAGTATVPWVVWEEKTGAKTSGIFAARLQGGERFVLLNGGRQISPAGVDATRPDITFAGLTPVVSWRENVGKGRIGYGRFTGAADNPAFVRDVPTDAAVGVSDRRAPVSSTCIAVPQTADGTACPAGAAPQTFLSFTDAHRPGRLLARIDLAGEKAPTARLAAPATLRVAAGARAVVKLKVTLSERATLTVTATRGTTVLRTLTVRRGAGTATVPVALGKARAGKVVLTTVARDAVGITSVSTRTVTVAVR